MPETTNAERANTRADKEGGDFQGRLTSELDREPPAASALTALRNWGLEDQEIAASLAVIVAQRLVRRLCSHSRREEEPTEAEVRWLRSLDQEVPDRLWHARGCDRCDQLGFYGRTGVFEVWRLTEPDYDLILANTDEKTLRAKLAGNGHELLLSDGMAKVRNGETCVSELRTMGGRGPTP